MDTVLVSPQIEVDALEVRYGPIAAVGPVSFTVRQGEQLTLLGPSGCGKTTTLRAIAGLERPRSKRRSVTRSIWCRWAPMRTATPRN